jgi:hypothetical protein
MYLLKDKLLKRLKIILKIPTEVKTIIYKKPINQKYIFLSLISMTKKKIEKTLVKTLPFWQLSSSEWELYG